MWCFEKNIDMVLYGIRYCNLHCSYNTRKQGKLFCMNIMVTTVRLQNYRQKIRNTVWFSVRSEASAILLREIWEIINTINRNVKEKYTYSPLFERTFYVLSLLRKPYIGMFLLTERNSRKILHLRKKKVDKRK